LTIALKNIDPDDPNALEMMQKSPDVPDEIKSLLNGNELNKIYLLTVLLNLCAKKLSSASVGMVKDPTSEKIEKIYYILRASLADKAWKTDTEVHNLKFLAGEENSSQQSVMGKPPEKAGKTYPPFKSGMMMQMVPQYHKTDAMLDVIQLTAAQKKQYKIRKNDEGGLYTQNGLTKEGDYLYAVSPKGGLYVIDEQKMLSDTIHHSTIRGGQPVLCAGYMSIIKDKTTGQMVVESLDRKSGHYKPTTRNFLLTALWLHEQKIIGPNCELHGVKDFKSNSDKVPLQAVLTEERFSGIRNEYAELKAGYQSELTQAGPSTDSATSGNDAAGSKFVM
jgi:hypothetical protein